MAGRIKISDTTAIIVAGGKGKRMGRCKQMLIVGQKPMLFHSIETFYKIENIKLIIVVTDKKTQKKCMENFKSKKIHYATPGRTRLESVMNGLKKTGKSKLIAIHDGARPLVSEKIITNCLLCAQKKGASIAAVKVKDTIKYSLNSKTVTKTPNRNLLWAAQTPQCYKTDILKKALKKSPKNKNLTDESQLLEKISVPIHLVKSDDTNIKITTPSDLTVANAFLEKNTDKLRSGLGYDIHRTISARPFIIGGVKIPHDKGLLGHSDGDVVIHAVCDAILGAVCAGEIGIYFPPTDLTLMGISSRVIAEKTLDILKSKNATLIQMDITIIAEEPKILPYYQTIKKSLSKIFKLSISNINFKAKSQERIGAIGKGNAVACHALVMVRYR